MTVSHLIVDIAMDEAREPKYASPSASEKRLDAKRMFLTKKREEVVLQKL